MPSFSDICHRHSFTFLIFRPTFKVMHTSILSRRSFSWLLHKVLTFPHILVTLVNCWIDLIDQIVIFYFSNYLFPIAFFSNWVPILAILFLILFHLSFSRISYIDSKFAYISREAYGVLLNRIPHWWPRTWHLIFRTEWSNSLTSLRWLCAK